MKNNRNRNKKNNKRKKQKPQGPDIENIYFFYFSYFLSTSMDYKKQKQEKEIRNNYLLIFARDRNRNIRKFNEGNNKYIYFCIFLNNSSRNSKNIFQPSHKF